VSLALIHLEAEKETMTEIKTPAVDAASAILKKLIFEVVLKEVMKRLITQYAFLSLPVVGPIFAFMMGKLATLFYEEMARLAVFAILDVQVNAEKKALEVATSALKKLLEATPILGVSEEQKNAALEKAKEEFKKKLADLVRLPVQLPFR